MSSKRLIAGETCWVVQDASEIRLLVDAAEYYECLRGMCLKAKRTLYILAWDIDSRTPLRGVQAPTDGLPETLLPFLQGLLQREPELQILILSWDFSLLYVWEREFLPQRQFVWKEQERLAFRLDGKHPAGASHHQKVVVIDDAVAFVGGLDLTLCRWDTPEHLRDDPRRITPDGLKYGTMHDAQIGIAGPAAVPLGDLFRERWLMATDEVLHKPAANTIALDGAQLSNHPVAISRTAAHDEGPGIREVQALTLKAIASAQRYIMIENQYLSSAVVGDALAERLREAEGPEVLVILPQAESGWLEQESMGLLKQRLLRKLKAADTGKRLRVMYPTVESVNGPCDVYVHSKILFVDDVFMKVGSSNMSNRSMSLDTECDISVESGDNAAAVKAIQNWKFTLLGEHLGLAPDQVKAAVEGAGSLVKAVDELSKPASTTGRKLKPVPETSSEPPAFDFSVYDGLIADPEKPLSPDVLMGHALPERQRKFVRGTLVVYAMASVAVLSLLAVAKFGDGNPFVESGLRWLRHAIDVQSQTAIGIASLALASFVASCLFFPLSLTMAAICLAAPGWRAFVILYSSAFASALTTYWIGRNVTVPLPSWLKRKSVRLQQRLKHGGFLAVLVARLVPVGSFTLINGVAGTLKIPFKAYVLANAVGLFPGIFLMSLLSGRLAAFWRKASSTNAFMAVGAAVCLLGGFALIGYFVRKQDAAPKSAPADQPSLASWSRR